MRLYISPGKHLFTNVDERIEHINKELENIDAIFVEDFTHDVGIADKVINWSAVPILLLPISAWLKGKNIFSNFTRSDDEIVYELQNTHNAPIVPVDKPIHEIFKSDRIIWGVSNWTLILIPIILLSQGWSWVILIFSVLFLTMASVALLFAALPGMSSEREFYMIREVRDVCKDEGFADVCLIVGSNHDQGLRDIAGTYLDIDLVI